MDYTDHLLKTFTDRAYRHTAMVTHKGTIVAFAMDEQRRIFYTVLDFDKAAGGAGQAGSLGEFDIKYWEEPRAVPFPREISQVGYSIVNPTRMPVVKKDSGGAEADPGELRPEEIDPFCSTTARLSADAPLQALSDGKFIYLFRQSTGADDNASVFKTKAGGASARGQQAEADYVTGGEGALVPVADSTLLVDRLVLTGATLSPRMEVRYRRSRNKHVPQSAKDSLGAQDMNQQPFYEPTHELDFVRGLRDGRFSVLLLPTQVAEVMQWQIFAYNGATEQIDSFNVERAPDGLFNTQGTTFYTSPDPQYRASVFEREAGTCPFTGEALIPLIEASGHAETALCFNGTSTKVQVAGYKGITGAGARTVEAWIKTASANAPIASWGSTATGGKWTFLVQSANGATGAVRVEVAGGYVVGATPVNDGQWHHVACTFDASGGNDVTAVRLYVDGVLEQTSATLPRAVNTAAGVDLLLGYDQMNRYFAGQIDEVRIWDRARGAAELQADMSFRLAGNEPGLCGYFRFDEGRGSTARDQSGNGRSGMIHARPPIVLSLNGTADHVDCGQIDFARNGYTVEAWFKADAATTDQRDIFAAAGSAHGILLELAASGTLRCHHRAPSGTGAVCEFFTTGTYKDGRWHHVAAVKDDSSVTLYVDGGKVGTGAATTHFAEPLHVIIGRLSQSQSLRYFKGSIADVRIWGHARSQGEIQAYALRRLGGAEAGLMGYWPLDEGSGATATDRSGKGHDGALRGTPTWVEDLPTIEPPAPAPAPAASSAVSFDGTNDKLDVPCAAALNPESLTVEAWVMSRGGTGYRSPLTSRSDLPPKGFILYATDQARWAFWVGNGTNFSNANGPSVQVSTWVHLAGTYDKATQTMRMFVNGVEVASLSGVTYVPNSTAPLRIGAGKSESTGDYFFNGKVMEVRLWSRARTAQEIQADMNRRLAGTEAGLAGYWPLDEGTGTIAKDRSAGGRNGTLLNSPAWVADAPGLAPAPAPVSEGSLRSGSLERPAADWVASDAPVGERPGFHRASFSFLGRAVVSGLTSVLYHQQEQAMVGHDQQARPVKRNARVMLAVSTGDAAGGGTPSYVATLDLGISRHGRLAQTPDLIDLGAPLASDANKDLSRLQELEQQLKTGGAPAAVQTEAEQIRKRLSVEVVLPMPLLSTDAFGLTISGGLLGFAYTGDTPYLFDSATGKLALYFRGETGQFFAAHYDTSTTRAQMRLPAGGGELVFAARSAEPEADQTTITVSDGPGATFCTVVIGNPKVGITETWQRVPRRGQAFSAVLNGRAGTPVFLGALSEAAGGTVTSLSLAEGARRPIEAGDTLLVGDTKVLVAAPVARGNKAVPIAGAALSAAAGAQVSLLPYDHAAHAATNRAVDRLEHGSLFFSVVPNGAGVAAQNGSASASAVTPSCHWRAESPGNALFFQGTSGHVTRQGDAAALAKLDAEGDLTLEAWINPVAVQGTARVIHHLTDGSRYTLGLQDASIGQAALKLDGNDDEVDLKTGLLNNLAAFTFEAWIRPSTKTGASRGILGQRHVMELMFWDDGTFRLQTNGTEVNWMVNVPYPYPVNEWHHIAVTGSGRDLRIYVDGVRQYGQTEGWNPSHPFTTYGTSSTASTIAPQATTCRVGGTFGRFAGEIDEVRYWGYARSQSDLREAMNRRLKGNESGLLGYWYFSNLEISQGRVLDRSGNGHHGYLVGGPTAAPTLTLIKGNVFFAGVGDQLRRSAVPVLADTWQHLAAVYRQSYALAFDGKDDHLAVEHATALNLNRDMTLEVFFRADDVSVPQGLVSKGRLHDGTSDAVPYALYVAEGGRLAFEYEDKSGTTHHFESSRSLQAGTFHRVAVTRKHDILVENRGTEASPDIKVNHVTTVHFYVDMTEAGNTRRTAPTPGENQKPLEMGLVADGNKAYRLKGVLGEARLWNRCLALQDVGRPLRGDEEGLVAFWRMEEKEGGVTRDEKGEHHAAIQGPTWVKNPDPDGSRLTLYHNGAPILAGPMTAPDWCSGTKQLTLGASRSGSEVKFPFQGTMEEVRIWKSARSQEQILDNLFSRLKGEKQDLIANYTFDEGTGSVVEDQGLRGSHLSLGGGPNAPAWTLSTAPISTDIAPVRSALAGIKTAFHDVIGSPPSVQEYADLQTDAEGNLGGVMKRCYGYVKDGAWHLMTGYKVGNLTTEWVGQVQADPQIIGFIEGAPPVPGENMTSTSAKVGEYADYNGTSVIELEEPKTVNYVFSSSSESGRDMSFDLSAKTGIQSRSQVGIGFVTEVEDTRARIGTHTTFETSTSNVNQAESSFGRNVTKTTRMELHGYWEEPENQGGQYINPAVGRRFVPENKGLALVQSDTMDVFALRLAHNNALVAYRMRPNPDIPKDWNILMFPINPRYVKQGTLDGRVGAGEDGSIQVDPDYPQATQYGEYSYFKPREAYALKKRIEREQQALATYYQQYSTAQGIGDQSTGSDVPRGVAARNLANTYVWTAEGGFFAEASEVMEATSESTSGSYSFVGMSGIQADFNLGIMKTATIFEIEALFGGHIETSKSRGMESEESFKISVTVAPDSDLQMHVNTEAEAAKYAGHIDQESLAAWHPDGTPVLRPGRVDAYRFMTFYLEPARENFEDFFNKVVDPIWLAQSNDPGAVALRQAQQVDKKPRCWRILHRVTFVSRILPEIEPDAQATTVQQAMQLADVSSNWTLIKKLEPFVRTRTESYSVFAAAVEQTLTTYLPELLPHAEEITAFAASYFGVSTATGGDIA